MFNFTEKEKQTLKELRHCNFLGLLTITVTNGLSTSSKNSGGLDSYRL